MFTIQQTESFVRWLTALRDHRAQARIIARIRRAGLGNFGDAKPVGAGVSEMRIDVGPGYRVYFTRRQERLILLLCGGDKSSQSRDIRRAVAMAQELES